MKETLDGYKIPESNNQNEMIEAIEHNTKKSGEEFNKLNIHEQIKKVIEENKKKLPLPTIELPKTGKLISLFVEDVSPILSGKKTLFFRPDEKAVVKIENLPTGHGHKKAIGFKAISPHEFVTEIENHINPYVYVWNSKLNIFEPKKKSMNSELSKIILSSDALKDALPVITTIYDIPMPVLINGVLRVPNIGYDDELKTWLNPKAPLLKVDMTLEEAKKIIEEIIDEFCFESAQDRINAISAIITPYLRGLYVRPTCRTPIMFWKANRERAGKDYGAGMTGIIYYGESIDDTPIVCDGKVNDEEFRKKILSVFKLGRNRYHSANNKGHINSAQLENLSTTENFTDRALGSNLTLTFPNTLEISLSANTGITFTPDLARRCLFIKLFLDIEDPNTRKFKNPDLHGWIREHRGDIISALYTFVRVWHEQGMPSGDTPFSSFPEWAKVCGGIMKVCGLGDPCIVNKEQIETGGDTETNDMKALFEFGYEYFKERNFKKNELTDILCNGNNPEVNELFADIEWNHGGQIKFGLLFEKFVGRIFSDIQLVCTNQKKQRKEYRFTKKTQKKFVDSVDSVEDVCNPVNKKGEGVINIAGCRTPSSSSTLSTNRSFQPSFQQNVFVDKFDDDQQIFENVVDDQQNTIINQQKEQENGEKSVVNNQQNDQQNITESDFLSGVFDDKEILDFVERQTKTDRRGILFDDLLKALDISEVRLKVLFERGLLIEQPKGVVRTI